MVEKKKRQFFDFFTRIEYWAGCSVRPLSYLNKKKNGFSYPLHPFLVKNPLIYPQPLMNKRSLFTFHCVCVSLKPPLPPKNTKFYSMCRFSAGKRRNPRLVEGRGVDVLIENERKITRAAEFARVSPFCEPQRRSRVTHKTSAYSFL